MATATKEEMICKNEITHEQIFYHFEQIFLSLYDYTDKCDRIVLIYRALEARTQYATLGNSGHISNNKFRKRLTHIIEGLLSPQKGNLPEI